MTYVPYLYLLHHGKSPKGRNGEVKDRGTWKATLQDHTDQSKPLETEDPNTVALVDQNEVELHFAGMLLCIETYGPPCILDQCS